MKLTVVVLDYDGTIAEDGKLNEDVRSAIAELRATGLTVVLATGRLLTDLHHAIGDLRIFDGIVAENGAVLAFPYSGRSTLLGSPASELLVHDLRARGVPLAVGECAIETDASCADIVLQTVRELELPLVLVFNRGRLMVLPQGISKATGLSAILRALRLSEHNAIAIGDAENDHALLAACELGVAVGWGSPALKDAADEVIDGTGPVAVAKYLRTLAGSSPVVGDRLDRHRVLLGTTLDDRSLTLSVRGRNVLVAGDPRSGKSWLTGLLCEQLILQHYCVHVIDPEGDYRPLETLPGVVAFGGASPPPRPFEVAHRLRHPDVSVVVDLSALTFNDKRDYVWSLLPLLAGMRRRGGVPHRVVIDEAHYFVEGADGRLLIDMDQGGYTLATYRPAQLPAAVLNASGVVVLTRTTDAYQLQALHAEGVARQAQRLSLGQAMLMPGCEEAADRPLTYHIAPRLTEHVRHRQKYLDVPVAQRQAFVFTRRGQPIGPPARTVIDFAKSLADCPLDVLNGHLDRGDFSRWVAEVFGDYDLASRMRQIEQLQRLRQPLDAADALRQQIEERYVELVEP